MKIRPLIYEQIGDYQFKIFEVEREKPENYHTELRQFIEAMQARYDRKKLADLFEQEEFRALSTLTQKALAVHLGNNSLCKKVIEEGESMCKALRDWERESRMEGRMEERISTIRLFLKNIGSIPESLNRKLEEEKNPDILMSWVQFAAKSESIEEFMKKAGI